MKRVDQATDSPRIAVAEPPYSERVSLVLERITPRQMEPLQHTDRRNSRCETSRKPRPGTQLAEKSL